MTDELMRRKEERLQGLVKEIKEWQDKVSDAKQELKDRKETLSNLQDQLLKVASEDSYQKEFNFD